MKGHSKAEKYHIMHAHLHNDLTDIVFVIRAWNSSEFFAHLSIQLG